MDRREFKAPRGRPDMREDGRRSGARGCRIGVVHGVAVLAGRTMDWHLHRDYGSLRAVGIVHIFFGWKN